MNVKQEWLGGPCSSLISIFFIPFGFRLLNSLEILGRALLS